MDWYLIGWLGAIIAAVCLFIFGLAWLGYAFDAPYQSRQCSRYGQSTNREVQFRQFSHWSYDCFVKLENGVWVSKSQIRGME